MVTESKFYFPVTLSSSSFAVPLYAPWVEALQGLSINDIAASVLATDSGAADHGLYTWNGTAWRYLVPLTVLTSWILHGYDATIYISPTADVPVPMGADVYLNGQKLSNFTMIPANSPHIYTLAVPSSSGGGGAVASVNGKTGLVNITGTGTVTVDNSGANIVIDGSDTLDEGVF